MSFIIPIYPKSPKISISFDENELPVLDCKPILGEPSNKVLVEISEELYVKSKLAARKSRLRHSEYLSTILNKGNEKECVYQAYCKDTFGGKREVTVPGVGRIDLLTSDTVIEVKCKSLWKAALGQVLAYAVSYPGYKKAIALTPDNSPYRKDVVEKVCSNYGVSVIWL